MLSPRKYVIWAVLLVALPCLASSIHYAVMDGKHDKVRRLLRDDSSLARATIGGGITPLHIAAWHNDTKSAGHLLRFGADINARTVNGETALHWAARRNSTEVLTLLVKSGADIESRSADGHSALDIAQQSESRAAALVLTAAHSRDRATLTGNARYAEARSAYDAGDYANASRLFNRLLIEYPESVDLNIDVARTATALGRHPQAAAAYERVLTHDPRNDTARFELAQSYLIQKRYDLGHRELRQVAARASNAALRENSAVMLATLQPAPKLQKWRAQLGFSLFHDSNVNIGPESDLISIAPVTFGLVTVDRLQLDTDNLGASASGAMLAGQLMALHDVGAEGNWLVSGSAGAYATVLDGQPNCETMCLTAETGPRYVAAELVLDLPAQLRYINRGHEALVNILSVRPTALVVVGRDAMWQWVNSATLEYRDYRELTDRNGAYVAGTELIRRFFGHGNSVAAGLTVYHEHAETEVFRNTGTELQCSSRLNLPYRCVLNAGLKYKRANYDKAGPLETEPRSDSQLEFVVAVSRILAPGWSLDLSCQYVDNSSTFNLYDYERIVTAMAASYTF